MADNVITHERFKKSKEDREQDRIKKMLEHPDVQLWNGMRITVNPDGVTVDVGVGGQVVHRSRPISYLEKAILQNAVIVEMKMMAVLEVYCPEIIDMTIPPSHSVDLDAMHELRDKKNEGTPE